MEATLQRQVIRMAPLNRLQVPGLTVGTQRHISLERSLRVVGKIRAGGDFVVIFVVQ